MTSDAPDQAASAAAPGRVLVVDDVEVNRDLLVRRVARAGHTVDQADRGEVALDMMRAALAAGAAYDVVLLDVMMPGLSGYEVLEHLRDDPELSAVRVIMVSAVDEIDSVVRCIELGADDYLPKPLNPVLLQARLASSMARKQLDDARRVATRALERELEVGREIQAGFFPSDLPDPDGWRLQAHFASARQVAGDFYDAFDLPGARFAVLVGDVCDKGVGAALYMALFRSLLRSRMLEAAEGAPSADLLVSAVRHTSDYLATTHDDANMFATVFAGIVDTGSGEVTYVNAGHDPPQVCRGGTVESLTPTGPALGLVPGCTFETGSVRLAAGEGLWIHTDGVTDATDPGGAPFGDERLASLLAGASPPFDELVADVVEAVDTHLAGRPAPDDVTMVFVARG